MKKLSKKEIEFLRESNAIEGVYEDDSLHYAKLAWEYLKGQDKLTAGAVLKTHKILMTNSGIEEKYKGAWRDVPVYIGGREGIISVKINDEIQSWLIDVDTSIMIPGMDGEHIRLDHITYERIHPFIDGNGRTGRMFMNWQRIKARLPILIIHEGEEQMEYYKWFK